MGTVTQKIASSLHHANCKVQNSECQNTISLYVFQFSMLVNNSSILLTYIEYLYNDAKKHTPVVQSDLYVFFLLVPFYKAYQRPIFTSQ